MVRTAAGIRISAGRSSKKVGKASGASTPSSVTNSKSKAGSSSSKLPPIPFQETPSWQKPITNFFKSNSPVKTTENKSEEKDNIVIDENSEDAEPVKKKLKLDSDCQENTSVLESEENADNETCEDSNNDETGVETTEENKENTLISTARLENGAESSKD